MSKAPKPTDYDSPWKQIIEELFNPFLEFFFPALHADIDFSRGYEIKSKELYKLLKQQEIGKRYADELIKVYLKDGTEQWLLIHIEVQNYKEEDFAKRMFVYYYRIFDKYNHQTISLVVFTDPDPNYRPDTFLQKGWGFEQKLHFPLVKIIDYQNKITELEKSVNPIAIIVLTHLKSLEAKDMGNEVKFDIKLNLIRSLYKKGYDKKQIIQLFTFIDWIVCLPEYLEDKINHEILLLEEDQKMPYVTSMQRLGERIGEERGEKRGEERGQEHGGKEEKYRVAEKMLEKGYPDQDIAEITELTKTELTAIKKRLKQRKSI